MRSSIPPKGRQHVTDELILRGLQVSSGGVRGVRIRNGLKTRHERPLRLEETVRKGKIKFTEEQIQALERFDPEFRERRIEVHATDELVAVDTFFAGTVKGVLKVYIETVLDCFSRPRLRPALHEEDARDRRPDPEQSRAALLRGAGREDPHHSERRRGRVLRPARQAPRRA